MVEEETRGEGDKIFLLPFVVHSKLVVGCKNFFSQYLWPIPKIQSLSYGRLFFLTLWL